MTSGTTQKHDVIIVGGGPAGAATALYLLRAGVTPLILEKERFPRYHIGESLTGEVGGSLRDLRLEEWMQAMNWPVKHGVNVYGPNGQNSFWVPVKRRDENQGLQATTTWQVRRSTFDQKLLEEAVERGADLRPCRAVAALVDDHRVTGIKIRTPQGRMENLHADVVIDASGQSTFLANAGAPVGEKERGTYDKQLAVFSQVVNAIRDPGEASGNTLIFYRQKNHWAWFIPLDDEVTSVGVVVPGEYYNAQKLSKHDFLLRELRTLNPELGRRLPDLTFVEDVYSASNYSYHIKQFTGPGFLCVGDSHRFIDPIFSFGVNFALKDAEFAAQAVVQYFSGQTKNNENPFAEYQARSERGQDIIQDLVDVFWEHPLPFVVLVHHQHRDGMIDMFAGRIFNDDIADSEALRALRRCKYTPAAGG
jgi:FADH2-dependent halogenase